MALYGKFGDEAAPPGIGTMAAGASLGLVPFLFVAIAFWAVLKPKPRVRSKYRGRKH